MSGLQLVLDNRVNVSDAATKVVRISGIYNNPQYWTPVGNTFTSTLTFSQITTPNYDTTLMCRNPRIRYLSQIVATANPPILNPAAALGANGAGCALRAYPLQSVTTAENATINGATVTLDARNTVSALQRRIPQRIVRGLASDCPCRPDTTSCLARDALGTALTSNQPLSSYYNSDGTSRGSFFPCYWDNGSHTVQFMVSEPLLVSPFSIYDEEVYLANVNTLNMIFTFANINDMYVFSAAQAVPAGTAVTIVSPVLELTYVQVNPAIVSIPRLVTYPYERVVFFNKQLSTMAHSNAAAQYTLQSDVIRLDSTPALMYIGCRIPMNERTSAIAAASQADAMLALGPTPGNGWSGLPGINITFGTRSGILSTASNAQMFRMAQRNGYNSNYNDWQYGSGSLMILNPVEDFGLNPQAGDVLPGESGAINFQIQATFNNTNFVDNTAAVGGADLAGFSLEMFIIVVYAGTFTIAPNQALPNIGDLSAGEVAALLQGAPNDGSMMSSEQLNPTINGGGLWSKAKSVLSGVARGANAALPHLESALPYARAALEKLGGGAITGAGLRHRRR